MGAKRVNPRLIKKNRPYQVSELAAVLGLHKNTICDWVKRGLEPVDKSKPMLFRGQDVIAWLHMRRDEARCPCSPGNMYCLKCQVPRAPALGIVDCYKINSTSGNLQAICERCETIMNRRVALDKIPTVMPDIDVQFPQAPSRLKGCRKAPSNCDSKEEG